jgi:hypothetical protein
MKQFVKATLMLRVLCFVVVLVCGGWQTAIAQSCPSTLEARRALERRGDPFGIFCTRAYQADYARKACARARSGMDMDECQYLAENLIEALQACARRGGPYGARCSAMIPDARNLLAWVNRNGVLIEHRRRQREGQDDFNRCSANVYSQCAAQCGGNSACLGACNANIGRCN